MRRYSETVEDTEYKLNFKPWTLLAQLRDINIINITFIRTRSIYIADASVHYAVQISLNGAPTTSARRLNPTPVIQCILCVASQPTCNSSLALNMPHNFPAYTHTTHHNGSRCTNKFAYKNSLQEANTASAPRPSTLQCIAGRGVVLKIWSRKSVRL